MNYSIRVRQNPNSTNTISLLYNSEKFAEIDHNELSGCGFNFCYVGKDHCQPAQPWGNLSDVEIKDANHATLQVTGSNIPNAFDVPGYEDLAGVLTEAYEQSARGKGKERHANNKPFTEQAIMRISRGRSGVGGLGYQVQKKTDEAIGMVERGNHEAACKELMGAIVYAAAAILLIREKRAGELPVSHGHHPV